MKALYGASTNVCVGCFISVAAISICMSLFLGFGSFFALSDRHKSDDGVSQEFTDLLPAWRTCRSSGGIFKRFRANDEKLETVHTVLASDKEHWQGMFAAASSVILNSASPDRFKFHFVVPKGTKSTVSKIALCHLPAGTKFNIVEFDGSQLEVPVDVGATRLNHGNLATPVNYARFFLPTLLGADVKRVIYLDVDVIARADLQLLFDEALKGKTEVVAAVPRPSVPIGNYMNFRLSFIRNRFNRKWPSFNAGVLVLDLHRWQRGNCSAVVKGWMKMNWEANDDFKLYQLGSNPPLLLTFANRFAEIDSRWNMDGLGWRRVSKKTIQRAFILHWTGVKKPWLTTGLHRKEWLPYHNSTCMF